MNYGTIGDPATVSLPAPAGYVKAQFLRQSDNGVNMAFAVNVKKIGFSRPTDQNPNANFQNLGPPERSFFQNHSPL
jgi:hypothetical protein